MIETKDAKNTSQGVENRVFQTIETLATCLLSEPSTKRIQLCMVTPWKQECGNAEYAERLSKALVPFADVVPVNLINFADDMSLRSRKDIRSHFENLLQQIHASNADIVHIQHEFCFFGKSIGRSNREFSRFVAKIQKPIVVTLHTWLDRPNSSRFRLKNLTNWLQPSDQNKGLYRTLRRCDAIVVHSHDTYSLVVSAFPRLRAKLSIVQIPIEPIDAGTTPPSIMKREGDKWLVLPGFVSKYKGHEHAISALNELPTNHKLVIAGGRHPKDRSATRYWMNLISTIEKKGLEDRVIFTGFLPTGVEQAALLKQGDIFLLPYDEVGQSGSAVLADALAHDKPVITSRARSMYAYRMTQDTVYSSVSTDVTDHKNFADVIRAGLEPTDRTEQTSAQRTSAQSRYSIHKIGGLYYDLYTKTLSDESS
jgi:glycosyltransferase involved in cell wall biosynthesis